MVLWNIIDVTDNTSNLLVASQSHLSGCLMAFGPKILGGGEDLRIIILLKNECSISDGDVWGGGYTQPLQDGKKKIWTLCT